ncbi:hypothetical protein [Clostridium gasigenes]|uniref:hypothetical protein n=1 Tax=Clostridium gasigenes TaxID=94869 RepID=UPI001C0BF4C7|nr:hypothetical protein [Clostridium gasigenes]MBU3106659.1 hypothetical protein [Clostridium gasigenes]
MKKSTWFALITVILIILILQSVGSKIKVYEKRKEYVSQEEVIKDYLKNINLMWGNRGRNGNILKIIPNLDLYETISDRARLMAGNEEDINYMQIPYFKEYSLENVTSSESLTLEQHLNTYKKIENYKVPKIREIYKITGKAILNIQKYTIDEIDEKGDIIDSDINWVYGDVCIILVLVDEGNGYVVDQYISRF